jgi:hypothetical protein
MSRTIWQFLHPRNIRGMSQLEKKVFTAVREFGAMHPGKLEKHFGNTRVINAWGGYSKATTRALEHLHYRGLLRIAREKKEFESMKAVSGVRSRSRTSYGCENWLWRSPRSAPFPQRALWPIRHVIDISVMYE